MKDKNQLIQQQNDLFRKDPIKAAAQGIKGQILITAGIAGMPQADQEEIARLVQDFENFCEGNDPYKEHDFGAFDHGGKKIFWKIDYYDSMYQHGSEKPHIPSETGRVLTIMLASEY